MSEVVAPPAYSRVIRSVLIVALTFGFADAFFYDGCVGYAKDNARKFLRSIGRSEAEFPRIDLDLTNRRAEELISRHGEALSLTQWTQDLGEPGLKHEDTVYYFGPGGHLAIALRGERIAGVTWENASHTEVDQLWQRWIGLGLALTGLFFLVRWIRVLTTRIKLTSEGLQFARRPPIAIRDIVALDTSLLWEGGPLQLTYVHRKQKKTLTWDPLDYRNVDVLVQALSDRLAAANPPDPEMADSAEPAPRVPPSSVTRSVVPKR